MIDLHLVELFVPEFHSLYMLHTWRDNEIQFFFFSYTLPYFRLSKQFQVIVASQKIIAKPLQILNNSMLSITEIYLLSLRSSL